MKIVKDKISLEELREMAKKMHDNLVKAMVYVEKKEKYYFLILETIFSSTQRVETHPFFTFCKIL